MLVGGVEDEDCTLDEAASAVVWLRVDSGVSQRVAVWTMESRVAAMLGRSKARGYHAMCNGERWRARRVIVVDVNADTSRSDAEGNVWRWDGSCERKVLGVLFGYPR